MRVCTSRLTDPHWRIQAACDRQGAARECCATHRAAHSGATARASARRLTDGRIRACCCAACSRARGQHGAASGTAPPGRPARRVWLQRRSGTTTCKSQHRQECCAGRGHRGAAGPRRRIHGLWQDERPGEDCERPSGARARALFFNALGGEHTCAARPTAARPDATQANPDNKKLIGALQVCVPHTCDERNARSARCAQPPTPRRRAFRRRWLAMKSCARSSSSSRRRSRRSRGTAMPRCCLAGA